MDNKYILNYYSNHHFSKNNVSSDIKSYLEHYFLDSDSIKETYLRIKLNIDKAPICPICGNKCRCNEKESKMYNETCGNRNCINKLTLLHRKQTKLERYGDENYNNINKTKNTIKDKFGEESIFKTTFFKSKAKQTKLERYGDENYINKEKIKQTLLNRYGVKNAASLPNNIFKTNNPQKNKKLHIKTQQTCFKKYGVKGFNYKKAKQTKLERYGDENYTNKEQAKQTKLERYGDENYTNKDQAKQTCLKKYGYITKLNDPLIKKNAHNEISNLKRYETQKKNNSFNKSKQELESYDLLKQKYSDVIYHYKDKDRYPFICDFYIPSLDLFIECQYSQFHNFRSYLNTDEDKKEIELLKQKSKQRKQITGKNKSKYDSVIYTWSYLDVRKRNIAKQNNLNYIEFWNIDELKYWLKVNVEK